MKFKRFKKLSFVQGKTFTEGMAWSELNGWKNKEQFFICQLYKE